MKNPDEIHVKNLRYQDSVARIAGVDLNTTVRVLRALEVAALANHDDDVSRAVSRVLKAGAINNGKAAELHSKPQEEAVEACNQHFKRVVKRQTWDRIRALQRLEGCPYYASNAVDEVMNGDHD